MRTLLISEIAQKLDPTHDDRSIDDLDLARCEHDLVYFVQECVWTYDPRLLPADPVMRFIPFPKQEDYLRWLEERELTGTSGLAEKSRDMGFTWLFCAYLVHRWIFRSGFKGGVGSRKFDLVDKIGDQDCIFEKLRFIIEHLPAALIPVGYQRKSGLGKLVNPVNGASITGEGGDEIGRGGRNTVYIVDESAFLEHPKKIDKALTANTDVRIDVSTPNGNGNPFARKRHSGLVSVFTMHWRDDPRKNHWQVVDETGQVIESGPGGSTPPADIPANLKLIFPWYEQKVLEADDESTIAQEYDIDYTASLEGIAIPAKWVEAAANLCERVKLPQDGPIIAGLDVADGGAENVYLTRQGPVVDHLRVRREENTTDTTNWALENCSADKAGHLNYDVVGVGSGISGPLKIRDRDGQLSITFRGVNTGESPTEAKWPDGRTASMMFANLKAELWWTVRLRFKKTYEFVDQGTAHPLDELISIPNDSTLKRQIANVRYFTTETGKIRIEKKEELRQRGVASPDRAEAMMLAFADPQVPPKPIGHATRALQVDLSRFRRR